MRRIIIFLCLVYLVVACNNKDKSLSFEQAFLKSLQKNNYDLLKDYLPDIAFYKSLGDKMEKRTDEEIKQYLDEKNEKIKVAWDNTLFNVIKRKIDLNKIKIKEVVYYYPFKKNKISEAMIISYEYENRTWDDLDFIVNRNNGKTVLLGIPNIITTLSMSDPELRSTNEAKTFLEIENPDFKAKLQKLTDSLVLLARGKKLNEFGGHLVYRGNDIKRKWRSPINISDSSDRMEAEKFMQRVSTDMDGCTSYSTGEIDTQKEIEGQWVALPLNCGTKTIIFAYLKINNQLMLGDIKVDVNVK